MTGRESTPLDRCPSGAVCFPFGCSGPLGCDCTCHAVPEDAGRETTRCCSRHHYTCAASFDDYPPDPCCPGCPCHPAPMDPLFTTEEAS